MRQRNGIHASRWMLLPALLTIMVATLTAQVVQGPTVRRDIHHDVSPPLLDLIKNAPPPSLTMQEAEPLRHIPFPPGLVPLEEDPVRQRSIAPLTPVTSRSFEGLGQGQYRFTVTRVPPDTNGAVGTTQYVQWVNTSFAIFSKSTGALIAGPTAGNTLWAGFGGGCQNNNNGDPIVLYDKLANRWVMSQFSVNPAPPYLQCIAVSRTSDATGTWNRYSFQYSGDNDYPKMGVWSDAYYETFVMFTQLGGSFVGADACAFDRTAMLNNRPATQVCFQQNSSVLALLPADIDGTTPPPAGSPNYMIYLGANSLNLYKFHVDFNIPSNSTFTGPTVINVAAFNPLCGWREFDEDDCVPQPGTPIGLAAISDRIMYRLAYRNFGTHESLVTNHTVAVSGGGGVRWYEIQNPNGTPTVAQQGTFAPDSTYRWMGSVAMDQAGDMAVGYSKSSSSVYPSIAFAGRIPTDPSGTLETETNVAIGAGIQNGIPRWGDYSAMTVDPTDDCTFWYTQEYMKTTSIWYWNTRIASFKFPGCPGPGSVTILTTQIPTTITAAAGYEIANRFTSSESGYITALRFYKVTGETGPHTLRLWSDTGTLLASVTTSNESLSGWQEQSLSSPVAITANVNYRVSFTVNVQCGKTLNAFSNGATISNPPLTANKGYYGVTGGAFPTTASDSNMFADIRFHF